MHLCRTTSQWAIIANRVNKSVPLDSSDTCSPLAIVFNVCDILCSSYVRVKRANKVLITTCLLYKLSSKRNNLYSTTRYQLYLLQTNAFLFKKKTLIKLHLRRSTNPFSYSNSYAKYCTCWCIVSFL